MSDLADYWPPVEPADPIGTARKCKRHQWRNGFAYNFPVAVSLHPTAIDPLAPITACARCPAIRDEAKARRGKSARRLGGDTERRIEKVYGPVKIGERGDPVDHLGRVWRWQSKATRALPPKWLVAITEPTLKRALPTTLHAAYAGMTGHYDPRRSLLIRSFVSRGIRARDWLFISPRDFVDEFGPRTDLPAGFVVIPGDWWLDHFGKDEGGQP